MPNETLSCEVAHAALPEPPPVVVGAPVVVDVVELVVVAFDDTDVPPPHAARSEPARTTAMPPAPRRGVELGHRATCITFPAGSCDARFRRSSGCERLVGHHSADRDARDA
jgi:hypothetical protein